MENVKKLNFFKRVKISILKPSNYNEIREGGIYISIRYFLSVIILLSIIVAIVSTFLQINVIKDASNYLNDKLPEITFKDNILSLQSEEPVILDDDIIKMYFGSSIVINTLLDEPSAIKEYSQLVKNGYPAIVFLNEEYIIINSKYNPESESVDGLQVHKYSDESSKFINDTSKEYHKSDIVSYIKTRTSFVYYLIQYLAVYIIMLTLLYALYILIIALMMWGLTKILKLNWGFKNSLMNTIYSSTLSILVFVIYMLVCYFTKFRLPYFDVISITLIFIYIFMLIYKEKKLQTRTK